MNGNWFPWGQQPVLYTQLYRKIVQTVRNITGPAYADKLAFVWAPFAADGYPFGKSKYTPNEKSPDFAALDTNKNGLLDANDDP